MRPAQPIWAVTLGMGLTTWQVEWPANVVVAAAVKCRRLRPAEQKHRKDAKG